MSYVVVPLRRPRKGFHVFWSKTIWPTDISSTQFIKILVNLSTIIAVSTKHCVGPRSASQMTWPYLCQTNIGSAKCRLAKWFSTKTLRTKIIAISVNAAIVVNGYPLLKPRPVIQNSRYLQFYIFLFFSRSMLSFECCCTMPSSTSTVAGGSGSTPWPSSTLRCPTKSSSFSSTTCTRSTNAEGQTTWCQCHKTFFPLSLWFRQSKPKCLYPASNSSRREGPYFEWDTKLLNFGWVLAQSPNIRLS